MVPALTLPRLIFGQGTHTELPNELGSLQVQRPLLISDRGLERAGLVAKVRKVSGNIGAVFLDVPENPTAAGADLALRAYKEGNCDGVIALGGGSVLDTAKLVAALAMTGLERAIDIIGMPDLIRSASPLVAIPTTVGTGSESSPVAALHLKAHGPAVGTRGPLLVPKLALCDPDLTRSLPRRLIAATAIDALSHCIEGFFAEPANPIIDALALDGAMRVFADVHVALQPDGDTARASLMAAAFAGGAAIHKGLGPAHAIALCCGDQDVHHGTVIGVILPHTTRLLARHLPQKASRLAIAMGLRRDGDLGEALQSMIASLDLPTTLAASGYQTDTIEPLVSAAAKSPFNRTSPYVPTMDEYRTILIETWAKP